MNLRCLFAQNLQFDLPLKIGTEDYLFSKRFKIHNRILQSNISATNLRQVSYRCEGSSLLNKLLPPPSPGPPDYDYHKAKTNLRDYMQLVLPKNWASEYLTSRFKFWWKCHFFEKPKFSKLAYLGIHEKFCHEEFPAFDHFPTSSSYVKFAWKINSNICFHIIYTSLKRKKKVHK